MNPEQSNLAPLHRSRRRAGRTLRILTASVVALVVVLAAYGVYSYESHLPPPGTTDLVVYTYPSFFGGDCGSNFSSVLAPFEAAYHVAVTLECPPGTLLATLEDERNAPSADVVIGLDEVTAPTAAADGLLIPYAPPELTDVPSDLVAELGPGHEATPYEWGYLSIDYTPEFSNATGGAVAHASFSDFTNNTTWAKGLLTEDPTVDITGEEFLLWEIAFYENVLHQDWTTWWKAVAPYIRTAPDWGTAFDEFSTPPNNPPMVVSYTTDAAYATATGAAGSLNCTVANWGGVEYGWRSVYGMGIVNGSAHVALDEALINWFLGGTVQAALPTNEWEYPANQTTALPASFSAALDPSAIVPLDDTMTPAQISADLPGYLETWQTLMNQYG
jgi:thiamine transport system substrate-binding protein